MGISITYRGYNNPVYDVHKATGAHYTWQNTVFGGWVAFAGLGPGNGVLTINGVGAFIKRGTIGLTLSPSLSESFIAFNQTSLVI